MLIGELARTTGTKVETIRYYEREGLVPAPLRTGGNYRSYDETHLNRLSFIRRSRDLGFSIEHIRELMSLADDHDRSCSAVDAIATAHLAEIDRKVADLGALREELVKHINGCARSTIGECQIIEALAPRRASGQASPARS